MQGIASQLLDKSRSFNFLSFVIEVHGIVPLNLFCPSHKVVNHESSEYFENVGTEPEKRLLLRRSCAKLEWNTGAGPSNALLRNLTINKVELCAVGSVKTLPLSWLLLRSTVTSCSADHRLTGTEPVSALSFKKISCKVLENADGITPTSLLLLSRSSSFTLEIMLGGIDPERLL